MTDRHTVDSITSDALDELYSRLASAEAVVSMVTNNATEWAKNEHAVDRGDAAIAAVGVFLLRAMALTGRHHPDLGEPQQPRTPAQCTCPSEDAMTHWFSVEDCTCVPWTRTTDELRPFQPGDTVDQIAGWKRGDDCPHHRPAPAREA